jgi:hypothetical protein
MRRMAVRVSGGPERPVCGPDRVPRVSRKSLIIEHIHGFLIEPLGVSIDNFDIISFPRQSFPLREVGQSGPFQKRGTVRIHLIEPCNQFRR